MANDLGAKLAAHLGLTAVATTGPFRGGSAVGAIEGYPVVAGVGKKGSTNGVLVHVRWKKDSLTITPEQLKERFGTSPEVLAAMEKKSLSSGQVKSLLTVEPDGASLFWTYSMRQPSVERIVKYRLAPPSFGSLLTNVCSTDQSGRTLARVFTVVSRDAFVSPGAGFDSRISCAPSG